MQRGIVIGAFPGLGKSYLAKKYENVLDLDLGIYKYVYDKNEDIDFEKRKALRKYEINKAWPQNYFDAILCGLINYDIVLVSYCKELANFLASKNINFYYFLPSKSSWQTLEERYIKRGNNKNYIDILHINFLYETTMPEHNFVKFEVPPDKYLEQALISENFL